MTAEGVSAYFTPLDYVLYLFAVFVVMVVYYQWRWSKICKGNVQILVVQQGGGGEYQLAPRVGGEVSIENPHTGTVRTGTGHSPAV